MGTAGSISTGARGLDRVYFYALAMDLGIDQRRGRRTRAKFETSYASRCRDRSGRGVALLMPSRDWKGRARHQPWYPVVACRASCHRLVLSTQGTSHPLSATLALRGATPARIEQRRVEPNTRHHQRAHPRSGRCHRGARRAALAVGGGRHGRRRARPYMGTARRVIPTIAIAITAAVTAQPFGIGQD